MKLADILLTDEKRPLVVKECQVLLDNEVSRKSGISGLAIKGGYKIVKKIKPGLIAEAFNDLLDDFTARLEPIFADYQQQGAQGGFKSFIATRSDEVAEALLGITDDRAARAENRTIKKTYEKLRPYGKKNVAEAIPAIAAMIDKFSQS